VDLLSFGISLEDAAFRRASERSSESVRKLSGRLVQARADLERFESKLKVANEIGNIAGHERYSAGVERAKARIGGLQGGIAERGKAAEFAASQRAIKAAADEAKRAMLGQKAAAKAAADEAKRAMLGQKAAAEAAAESAANASASMKDFTGVLGGAATAAVVAGAAVIAMAARIAEGAVETALSVTEQNRQLSASFEALGAAPGEGEATLAFLDDLSTKLPQSRTQLAAWTNQLKAEGITGSGELRKQLQALAAAQAITAPTGGQGAEAYAQLAKKIHIAVEEQKGLKLGDRQLTALYKSGLNVAEVADRLGISTKALAAGLKAGTIDAAKFGDVLADTLIEKGKGPLDAMWNTIGALKAKGSETFGHLFDAIDTSPLTDAIKSTIELGNKGEPSGQALKKGITGGVNAIIAAIGKGITAAEHFFLRLEIRALELKIALNPLLAIMERIGLVGKAETGVPQLERGHFGAAISSGGAAANGNEGPHDTSGQTAAGATIKSVLQKTSLLGAAASVAGLLPVAGLVTALAYPTYRKIAQIDSSTAPERPPQRVIGVSAGPALAGSLNGGNGGPVDKSIRIDHVVINQQVPAGTTDATSVSATGLSTALERMQLASGR
jgi:hypothetical protein